MLEIITVSEKMQGELLMLKWRKRRIHAARWHYVSLSMIPFLRKKKIHRKA